MTTMNEAAVGGNVSHANGVEVDGEILFFTDFNYMFPNLARKDAHLIKNPNSADTAQLLVDLGECMFELEDLDDPAIFDSDTEAVFTYLGQFIDHDLTARTDRETDRPPKSSGPAKPLSHIDPPEDVEPIDPDEIVAVLKNARRPQFDLDSVYADGPLMVDSQGHQGHGATVAERFGLFTSNRRLRLTKLGPQQIDIPRVSSGERLGRSVIADGRNDENLNISQLHAAFISFHNAVADALPASLSSAQRYARARQLVRWAYQYIVIEEYLRKVCADGVVSDTLANGPRYYGHSAGGSASFMPLEFSVAAFRFGHTMVRPTYDVNSSVNLAIDDILFPGRTDLPRRQNEQFLDGNGRLKSKFAIDWNFYAPGGASVQQARRFDIQLAKGLGNLTFEDTTFDALKMLPVRNLLRGFSLSIPTGQAIACAMGIEPISPSLLNPESSPALTKILKKNDFLTRTPLFYYILREAMVHSSGKTLGAMGSRLVCETIVGLMKSNPNSYMNNRHDNAVQFDGIQVAPGTKIRSISDLLRFAGVF